MRFGQTQKTHLGAVFFRRWGVLLQPRHDCPAPDTDVVFEGIRTK